MGYRNPILTATDPVARQQASDALNAANAAQSTANARNRVYGPSTLPPATPAGGFIAGDSWLKKLTAGVQLNVWTITNGAGSWVAQQYGPGTLAAGAVVAGTVAAGAIDGQTITGVTVSGGEVNTGAAGTPRVRIFEGKDTAGNPLGYVVFENGVAGDTNASIYVDSTGITINGGKHLGHLAGILRLATDGNSAFATIQGDLTVNGDKINGDTGWLTCSGVSGFTPLSGIETPKARILDGIVYLRGGWSGSALNSNTTYTLGSLPASIPPPPDNIIFGGGGSTGAALGSLWVTTSGDLQVRTGPTVSNYYKWSGVSYPAS